MMDLYVGPSNTNTNTNEKNLSKGKTTTTTTKQNTMKGVYVPPAPPHMFGSPPESVRKTNVRGQQPGTPSTSTPTTVASTISGIGIHSSLSPQKKTSPININKNKNRLNNSPHKHKNSPTNKNKITNTTTTTSIKAIPLRHSSSTNSSSTGIELCPYLEDALVRRIQAMVRMYLAKCKCSKLRRFKQQRQRLQRLQQQLEKQEQQQSAALLKPPISPTRKKQESVAALLKPPKSPTHKKQQESTTATTSTSGHYKEISFLDERSHKMFANVRTSELTMSTFGSFVSIGTFDDSYSERNGDDDDEDNDHETQDDDDTTQISSATELESLGSFVAAAHKEEQQRKQQQLQGTSFTKQPNQRKISRSTLGQIEETNSSTNDYLLSEMVQHATTANKNNNAHHHQSISHLVSPRWNDSAAVAEMKQQQKKKNIHQQQQNHKSYSSFFYQQPSIYDPHHQQQQQHETSFSTLAAGEVPDSAVIPPSRKLSPYYNNKNTNKSSMGSTDDNYNDRNNKKGNDDDDNDNNTMESSSGVISTPVVLEKGGGKTPALPTRKPSLDACSFLTSNSEKEEEESTSTTPLTTTKQIMVNRPTPGVGVGQRTSSILSTSTMGDDSIQLQHLPPQPLPHGAGGVAGGAGQKSHTMSSLTFDDSVLGPPTGAYSGRKSGTLSSLTGDEGEGSRPPFAQGGRKSSTMSSLTGEEGRSSIGMDTMTSNGLEGFPILNEGDDDDDDDAPERDGADRLYPLRPATVAGMSMRDGPVRRPSRKLTPEFRNNSNRTMEGGSDEVIADIVATGRSNPTKDDEQEQEQGTKLRFPGGQGENYDEAYANAGYVEGDGFLQGHRISSLTSYWSASSTIASAPSLPPKANTTIIRQSGTTLSTTTPATLPMRPSLESGDIILVLEQQQQQQRSPQSQTLMGSGGGGNGGGVMIVIPSQDKDNLQGNADDCPVQRPERKKSTTALLQSRKQPSSGML